MRKAMSKSQIILYIYESLKKDGSISKKDIQDRCLINDLTFMRYIKEIREYLEKTSSNLTIKYSEKEERYYLLKKLQKD